jgi:hypothetical protein
MLWPWQSPPLLARQLPSRRPTKVDFVFIKRCHATILQALKLASLPQGSPEPTLTGGIYAPSFDK